MKNPEIYSQPSIIFTPLAHKSRDGEEREEGTRSINELKSKILWHFFLFSLSFLGIFTPMGVGHRGGESLWKGKIRVETCDKNAIIMRFCPPHSFIIILEIKATISTFSSHFEREEKR